MAEDQTLRMVEDQTLRMVEERTSKILEKKQYLEDVVVTATRSEKDASLAPGSVSIIDSDDIEKRNIKVIGEALNALPGVLDRRSTGLLDPIANISMRGLPGSYRTLMMIDGMSINDPYYGGQNDMLGLSPENVERIEVVRGPFSSLYGGYAMGGVVNVITKTPEKRELLLKVGYGSSFNSGEGLDALKRLYFSYGDRFNDKLSTSISYGYRSTEGYPTDFNVSSYQPPPDVSGGSETTSAYGATRYMIGDKGNRDWTDDKLSLKAKYDFSATTNLGFSFTLNRVEYDYDRPHTYLKDSSGQEVWSYTGVSESSFYTGIYDRESTNSQINFETMFSDLKMKVTMGLLDCNKSWTASPGSNANSEGGQGTSTDTPFTAYNTDLQFTLPLLERHLLTFGGTFRTSEVETSSHAMADWLDEDSQTDELTYEAKGKERGYALFVQDEIAILDNLTAYFGFREDWWECYDGYANDVGESGYPMSYDSRSASYFSPKASLVYSPLEKTTLKTSIGKAFRPPSVYELYRTYTGSYGTVYASNPDLDPETTTSWDLGIEQKLWQGAKIGLTYFDNHIKDLIYSTYVGGQYEKQNAGKATTKGVEIEAEQKFADGLTLFANYTYTDAKITENSIKPETVGKKLTDVPETMYNLGASFEKGAFFGSIVGRYVGKRYSSDTNTDTTENVFGSYDPYFVTDIKVAYKITDNVTLSLSGDNIFDEDYYVYRKAPGASWYSELSLSF